MITGISVGVLEYAPCFASLNPEAEKWLPGLMKDLSFTRGEHILREGEPCPGLFVVKSGMVKLYRSAPDGEEQILRVARRGGMF